MQKRLLCIADTHFCHKTGPYDGSNISPQSKFLNKCWSQMIKDVGHVDGVLHCGDVSEGKNRHSEGLGCYTTDAQEQVDVAERYLRELDFDQLYMVKGTGYHGEDNPNIEQMVAKAFRDKDAKYGIYQILNLGPKRIHAIHKISMAKSAAYNDIFDAVVNSPEWGKFDQLMRAHTHKYMYTETPMCSLTMLPCFKLMDDFIMERGIKRVPDIGYVLLEWDGHILTRQFVKFDIPKKLLFTEYQV